VPPVEVDSKFHHTGEREARCPLYDYILIEKIPECRQALSMLDINTCLQATPRKALWIVKAFPRLNFMALLEHFPVCGAFCSPDFLLF
jgi:hypothetical protein